MGQTLCGVALIRFFTFTYPFSSSGRLKQILIIDCFPHKALLVQAFCDSEVEIVAYKR